MGDNPCSEESERSRDCLKANNYDKSQCGAYFENYRVCKEFWMWVKVARIRAGIRPTLPPANERPAMKKHYLITGQVPTTTVPESAESAESPV